jgi:hypothetical protein
MMKGPDQMVDDSFEQKIKELEEIITAQAVQIDTLARLLLEKGIVDEEDFYTKLRQVQAEYQIKTTVSH